MGRSRVLSFMSAFSASSSNAPSPSSQRSPEPDAHSPPFIPHTSGPSRDSPTPARTTRIERSSSRPLSMVQTYQPPLMEVAQDTLPELQPIFTLLNSHSNKLYQEGYFLKLNDLDTHGRPYPDRTWTECFAQLVGTVLSLWDASALDAAGQDGEVVPTFVNLTDASIKMIETLPTRNQGVEPLHNVLSISTAGKNRYLLHFNSLHSLTQWTAGIRLAMYEHATLQEAYTGALIAGKGKELNNINLILQPSKFKTEEWVRVRFGAGTPWRRCWCVISPPGEKELKQAQKEQNKMLKKKNSAYDRTPSHPKGDVKFYESKKTKKVQPIATITDAYSAYAIYPQSKPLIDQSTLVKVEGTIKIHSNPPSTTEGFVFVMPEVHPAVSGFEMMLRFLFPVFDVFVLYGRPTRLIADTLDPRSLMFAMPRQRRYGYLDILDVATLIHTDGSQNWSEREWRLKLKEATAKRMRTLQASATRPGSTTGSRRGTVRTSFRARASTLQFDDGSSVRSTPSITRHGTAPIRPEDAFGAGVTKPGSVPPAGPPFPTPAHQRSVSEAIGYSRYQTQTPSRLSYETGAPPPPPHQVPVGPSYSNEAISSAGSPNPQRSSTESEPPAAQIEELQPAQPLQPVAAPPAFSHRPGEMPTSKPYGAPELRRAKSRMSTETLSQLANTGALTGGASAAAGAAAAWRVSQEWRNNENLPRRSGEDGQRGVFVATDNARMTADQTQDMVTVGYGPTVNDRKLPAVPGSTEQSAMNYQNISPYAADAVISSSHNPPTSSANYYIPTSRPEPPRLDTSRSIARKPLPSQAQAKQSREESPPVRTSSLDSLQRHFLDEEALAKVMARPTDSTDLSPYPLERGNSNTSSNYDVSEASPDYASTRKSFDSRPSGERPRAGVLRTVGTAGPEPVPEVVVGDVHYTSQEQRQPSTNDTDVPPVDFGPTLSYRPGASNTRASHTGVPSNQVSSVSQERLRTHSPGPSGDSKRGSWILSGRQSPAQLADPTQHSRAQSRSSNRSALIPDADNGRSQSRALDGEERRHMPWQPGMAVPGATGRVEEGLTPDQYAQQRAPRATPVYAHQRTPSGNVLRSNTPPTTWTSQNSKDLPPRPHSRGASMILPTSSGLVNGPDYSAHLSAREQEHVARVTGSPLIDMTAARQRPQSTGGGLVGAIEAREREKRELKEGLRGSMVQQAIRHRQQQSWQGQPYGQDYGNPEFDAPEAMQASYSGASVYMQPPDNYAQQPGQGYPQVQAQFDSQAGGWPAAVDDHRYQQGWPNQGYSTRRS